MTREQWLLTILSLSWSGWLLSFIIGKWVQRRDDSSQIPVYRIAQLETRMELAGEKMSDLANVVQVMPDKMRLEFVTRREWDATERRRQQQPREEP